MADIENVKQGLWCCDTTNRNGCPFKNEKDETYPLFCRHVLNRDALSVIEELHAEIARLQPKKGKWIFTGQKNAYGGTVIQCPFCDDKYAVSDPGSEHFCRNCGAKLAECFSPKDGEWDG